MRIDTHHHHKKAGENLAFVFFMNLTFNIIVIAGGLATNSMAILADCIHDMSDTISIAFAWFLEHVAQKDSTDKYSYGYQRFSILGAVIISIFVIIMALLILQEAIPRLFAPESVDANGMLLMAIVGLVFKSISVYRLHGGETFNEKAILLHQLGDVLEWITILILSLVLMFWDGAPYLDPFVSIGIALWLIFNLGMNLYKSVEVLLQKTPNHFDVKEFKVNVLNIEGIKSFDDFHVWSLDGIDSVLTLKVSIDDWNNQEKIKNDIYNIASKYHIVDITIEFD
ncbi:cobalt-zinc-cadmium efflux system protein [Methanobrevibacter gottschalkii]|uniref:Cobalt-zinc-cadmium efflux system protein n=2 Tax=Methanobrevibacter gottschalkii TaxID=190974 RepID=A0A3N5C124_9EURY|nr:MULTISPECIES: cation diffusion facilitator family transporter [Methanobrevibacter]MCQ2969953.1 cation diffusion facilitator family transporter [archaeon]OEC95215.1 metal transporter [Methanobrevibacter sp. A27]RPF51825.1 cobalt-zinc-cadmium efflux system protein [Methanobrevibacter gottschalkii DSM 11977]SEK94844.1 cobalt-zinc-cadmium efflux system protein [Methanobrevibacter gottschalkii]